MFPNKIYETRCTVCKAKGFVKAIFLSVPQHITDGGVSYPGYPCNGMHTLKELRDALGMEVKAGEDGARICRASQTRPVGPIDDRTEEEKNSCPRT